MPGSLRRPDEYHLHLPERSAQQVRIRGRIFGVARSIAGFNAEADPGAIDIVIFKKFPTNKY